MANFSKQFVDDVVLPDGSIATCVADVDKYLRQSGLALASDYSPEYMKSIREKQELNRQKEIFADFIYNYKRMIWNE